MTAVEALAARIYAILARDKDDTPHVRAAMRGDPNARAGDLPMTARRIAMLADRHFAASPANQAGSVGEVEVERLKRIRTSMALLQQNSEGCAVNHYGDDAQTFGMPAWLADTRADLDDFTAILAALHPIDSRAAQEKGSADA